MYNFKIVKIDYKYCDYLRQFDSRVSYNAGLKELRPFIGILFNIGKMEYFAPLSSPKPKHIFLKNNIDMLKIDKGKYGVINFNNMIPVTGNNYELFDLSVNSNNKEILKRQILLRAQLRWLNNNANIVKNKSKKLYNYYINNRLPESVKNRCCNFKLLEEKCDEYNK